MVGRRVEVVADLQQVVVSCDGRVVARHERCWADHQSIADPAHVAAAAELRQARRLVAVRPMDTAVEHRDLTDYDQMFGLVGGNNDENEESRLMATKTSSVNGNGRNVSSEIAYLTRALKAPSLAGAVERLAERARAEGWSHEEFLAACLQREVAARESHGGEGRVRAARFPSRKSLEEFDFDHQRSLKRDTINSPRDAGFHCWQGERGLPRPSRHRQDALVDRAGDPSLSGRASSRVRHGRGVGGPARRGPSRRPIAGGVDQAGPLSRC